MKEALKLAKTAAKEGEVPVGAVVVKDGRVIGEGKNTRENDIDISGHAEINALKSAAKAVGSWRLDSCDIYVTLEPCPMCAAAIAASRIRAVYFGAFDKKAGAIESMTRLFDLPFENKPSFYGGVSQDECSALISEFFTEKRKLQNETDN